MAARFRLVNYYNLPIYIYIHLYNQAYYDHQVLYVYVYMPDTLISQTYINIHFPLYTYTNGRKIQVSELL